MAFFFKKGGLIMDNDVVFGIIMASIGFLVGSIMTVILKGVLW